MFTRKRCVVTGAGAGIGRIIALSLAAAGADVWAADVDAEALAELTEAGARQGTPIAVRQTDVTDLPALARLCDEVTSSNNHGLDFWINNAGVAGLGDFLEFSHDDFLRVMAVNLQGVVNGTRVALAAMEAAGSGRIVNMASVAGHLPAPYMSAYCASKHAVVGFTRALQAELHLKGSPVRLMLVSPGFVDTAIIAKGEALGYPEWLAFMLATPDSVAAAVLRGLRADRDEIYPTLNGRLMKRMYGLFPKTTVKSAKILLTKSWRDLVFNRIGR